MGTEMSGGIFALVAMITFAAMLAVWGIWWVSFRLGRFSGPMPAPRVPAPPRARSPWLIFTALLGAAAIAVWVFANRSPSLEGQNLAGQSLRNGNLAHRNLAGVNLSGAQLENADLAGANLQNANLSGAELENADLIGAQLQNAKLMNAQLENADLDGANLYDANLTNAQMENADLDGAHFDSANLFGAVVSQDQLNKACGAFVSLPYGLGIASC